MSESSQFPLERDGFRELVRHPAAHAVLLGHYRLGEHAGVVALRRLLAEMDPEARLRRAMEIHYGDEARHSQLFGDWMRRLGVEPPALPDDLDGFFARDQEEFRQERKLLESLPADIRRIIVFCGINAIERLAYTQFEHHLLALDRAEDVSALEGVMQEEKFHLNYVEAELERLSAGPHAAIVATALEQSRARAEDFRAMREVQTRNEIARALGA